MSEKKYNLRNINLNFTSTRIQNLDMLFVLFEILLLTLLPWPVWKLFLYEARKEDHTATPLSGKISNFVIRGRARKILLLLLLYLSFLLLAAYFSSFLLHLLTITGIIVAILYGFRSRPEYGKQSLLPLGSLALFPIESATNESFFIDHAKKFGPVFKISSPPDHRYLSLRPMVCFTNLKLGRDFLRQHDSSLRLEPVAPFSLQFESGLLRNMSEKDHLHYSKLHHAAYTALNKSHVLEICTAEAHNILNNMASLENNPAGAGVDPRPYFDDMMYRILAQVLFGLVPGSKEFEELERLSINLDLIRVQRNTRKAEFQPKLNEFIDFLQSSCKKSQALKMQSTWFKPVIVLLAETDPKALLDRNAICNLINDFWSGRIDTTGLLTWTTKFLSDNQDSLDAINDRSLQPESVVKEVLRLSQSEWLLRRTTSEINFGGFRIPTGWNIRVCVREAHRDESIFECPQSFTPERFDDGKLTPSVYSPFGLHKHKCVGWQISHAAVIGLIENLSREFDFVKTDDGPVTHLWLHWAPSRQLKINVSNKINPVLSSHKKPALQS